MTTAVRAVLAGIEDGPPTQHPTTPEEPVTENTTVADYTAEIVERTVVVTWPDNGRGGATPPLDSWSECAWGQATLHEIDEGSVSGCSILRWRNDPRPDAELVALSLALVSGKGEPVSSAVRVPATDRTALRDRVAAALSDARRPGLGGMTEADAVAHMADAVLAVLPEPAGRAAVLREAAEALGRMDYDTDSNDYGYDTYRDAWNGGVMDGADLLRRLAAGCPQCGDAGACNGGPCPLAAGPAAVVSGRTADETQDVARCSAAAFKRPHGPHSWEPQPGMEPVRCPGACRCEHPADEHSVYGCVDGCPCEHLPARTRPAVGGAQQRAATVDPAVCPRCKGDNSEAFELCERCAPAVGGAQQPKGA